MSIAGHIFIELFQSERLRDSETRAAASEREVSLQQQNIKKLEVQLHQLQDLLASREREHQ